MGVTAVLCGEKRDRAAIDELPPVQRSAFYLRFSEEWEHGETCNALSVTATHLRSCMAEYAKGKSQ